LREKLAENARLLRANQSVGVRADWAVLLALLPEIMTDDIVLHDLRLNTIGTERPFIRETRSISPDQRRELGSEASITFELAGLGRSQSAVTQFVLHLEQLALFHNVNLTDTRRQEMDEEEAVAFRLLCVLNSDTEESS